MFFPSFFVSLELGIYLGDDMAQGGVRLQPT